MTETKTVKVHVCEDCKHNAGSHQKNPEWTGEGRPRSGGTCSLGGCSCWKTESQVKAEFPAVERTAYAGYNPVTKRWGEW